MKVFTLAVGLATGYVLGSRAGREKYEQIATGYQKVSSHPTVVQAQEKAKQLLTSGAGAVTSKLDPTTPDEQPELPVSPVRPQPPRRKNPTPPPAATSGLVNDPLV